MTAAIAIGICCAVGAILLISGFVPAPVPLVHALDRLNARHPTTFGAGALDRHPSVLTRVLGQTWADTPFALRLSVGTAADLRVTGTTRAEHLAQRAAFALTGLLWAPFTTAVMWAGGVHVGFELPLWVSIGLCPLGFVWPSISLRARAAERRRSFRHALSSFLDVVSISLAGGRGVDAALHHGAEAGSGWAFDELRAALLEARLLGDTPWAALARLGTELDIPELGELAASASLAGAEGARVRASLAAKARAIRLHGLADVEAAAHAASERMSVPVVLLLVAFVVFLAYPAIVQVVNGI
jgi:Flp pilus assembly protein TadB